MKKFRNILSGVLIFFCLFCSCSGGMGPGGSVPLKEEGIEKETENPDDDEDEDETEDDETGDDETGDDETEEIENTSKKIPPTPVFLYCKTVSEKEIVFGFSQPVTLVSLEFNPKLGFKLIEEGSEVKISLTEDTDPGLRVEANLLVKDEYKNTVSKQVSFRTRNNRVPKMQINELRTEYSKPKAEFIEFKMLSAGNLGALRVFIAGNYKAPLVYEFAAVDVEAEDYVVLHLRKLDESCKDEYDSLDESGGIDSSPTARDFWIPGSTKLLHKTDAVYVLDQDDKVLDAVMLAEKPDSVWGKDYFANAAEFLFSQGAWKSPVGAVCSPADAVNSSTTTLTRSICRDETVENTHTAADWYVTVSSGATPGKPNKPNRL